MHFARGGELEVRRLPSSSSGAVHVLLRSTHGHREAPRDPCHGTAAPAKAGSCAPIQHDIILVVLVTPVTPSLPVRPPASGLAVLELVTGNFKLNLPVPTATASGSHGATGTGSELDSESESDSEFRRRVTVAGGPVTQAQLELASITTVVFSTSTTVVLPAAWHFNCTHQLQVELEADTQAGNFEPACRRRGGAGSRRTPGPPPPARGH